MELLGLMAEPASPAKAGLGPDVCQAVQALVVESMESHLWSLSLRITCNL